MSEIVRCAGCGYVREAHESVCTQCGTAPSFRGRSRYALAGFLGSAGLAITLAACYGAAPQRTVPNSPKPDPQPSASASDSAEAPSTAPVGSTPAP